MKWIFIQSILRWTFPSVCNRPLVCPYLLRNAIIDKPNQAWSIDITYSNQTRFSIFDSCYWLAQSLHRWLGSRWYAWYQNAGKAWMAKAARRITSWLSVKFRNSNIMKLIWHNTTLSKKPELPSDSISTLKTLSSVILHLIIRHRLNATIRQCCCHM